MSKGPDAFPELKKVMFKGVCCYITEILKMTVVFMAISNFVCSFDLLQTIIQTV